MELIAGLPVVGTLVFTVAPFLIVLSIVVFVHEFGHYIVGRWCGIRSEIFSIGFGPRLFGWDDRRGTHWQVAALPLGGFVKFVGDMDPASAKGRDDDDLSPQDRKHAFHNASLGARAATVAAGPVFNFILSIILVAALAMVIGRPSDEPVIGDVSGAAAETGLRAGDRIISIDGVEIDSIGEVASTLTRLDGRPVAAVIERNGAVQEIQIDHSSRPVVRGVLPATPADRAGILPGDVVLSIGGEPVETYYDLQVLSAEQSSGEEVEVAVEREGERILVTLTPDMVEREHPVTGERMMLPTMGISGGLTGLEPRVEGVGPGEAVRHGARQTWAIISGTVGYLAAIAAGEADASQVGGPIGIAQISGEAAAAGLTSFIWLIALLSTSIGLINLFPVPILDGGHLMFYALEALRGRPISSGALRVGNMIGLSLVLLLMVFATYNDLARI